MKMFKPSKRVTETDYKLGVWSNKARGCGISVDCDEQGFILKPLEKSEAAMSNIVRMLFCVEYRDSLPVIERYQRTYREPAQGQCECGRIVHLEGDTECKCGRFYNCWGQELAHPRYWGEETGERFDDHGNQTHFLDDY
jgi:hypothetical protein